MRKSLTTLLALLLLASTAFARTFRVHYSIRGSGDDITVQAESPTEADRTVIEMFHPVNAGHYGAGQWEHLLQVG